MALKLTVAERKARDVLAIRLGGAAESVNDTLAAYNAILADVQEWRDGLHARVAEEIDGKSDRWQEGDKGQAAADWRDEIENMDVEEIDVPELGHADALENLPEEMEG